LFVLGTVLFFTAKLLQTLSTPKYPIEILIRAKDEAQNKKQVDDVLEAMKSAGVCGNPDTFCLYLPLQDGFLCKI